tara:strand:- start:1402 stop:1704 length:303 start_codon:yes stop_codon:yes gene_type:complete
VRGSSRRRSRLWLIRFFGAMQSGSIIRSSTSISMSTISTITRVVAMEPVLPVLVPLTLPWTVPTIAIVAAAVQQTLGQQSWGARTRVALARAIVTRVDNA